MYLLGLGSKPALWSLATHGTEGAHGGASRTHSQPPESSGATQVLHHLFQSQERMEKAMWCLETTVDLGSEDLAVEPCLATSQPWSLRPVT